MDPSKKYILRLKNIYMCMKFLHGIGATIRIGGDTYCLLYAGFLILFLKFEKWYT